MEPVRPVHELALSRVLVLAAEDGPPIDPSDPSRLLGGGDIDRASLFDVVRHQETSPKRSS